MEISDYVSEEVSAGEETRYVETVFSFRTE
jgi:hypothetical protein